MPAQPAFTRLLVGFCTLMFAAGAGDTVDFLPVAPMDMLQKVGSPSFESSVRKRGGLASTQASRPRTDRRLEGVMAEVERLTDRQNDARAEWLADQASQTSPCLRSLLAKTSAEVFVPVPQAKRVFFSSPGQDSEPFEISGHPNASVHLGPLFSCSRARIVVRSRQPSQGEAVVKERGSFRMFAVSYHGPEGKPCFHDDTIMYRGCCSPIVHPLPVQHTLQPDGSVEYHASFFPDPSSDHYVIVIESVYGDRALDRANTSECFLSPPLNLGPVQEGHAPSASQVPKLFPGETSACMPLLPQLVPPMHYFFLDTLPRGNVTLKYPGNYQGPRGNKTHRVCPGCSLIASYGPNRLVVRYPKLLARYYPDHVTNATIYGRLINNDFIVNVNPSYYHDSKLHGYVVDFDIRDPGEYTLEMGISWYLGHQSPGQVPVPAPVLVPRGDWTEATVYVYRTLDFVRTLIRDGLPLALTLPAEEVRETELPRFRSQRCTGGDHYGRWVNMKNTRCLPPYCTGKHREVINAEHWSETARTWVWVPHECYYHMFNKTDVNTCAAKLGINWIHHTGDSQIREVVSHVKFLNGSAASVTRYSKCQFTMDGSTNNLQVSYRFYDGMGEWSQVDFTRQRNFWQDDYPYLDSFHLAASNVSGFALPKALYWVAVEERRPSVFVMNTATAYASKHQSMDNFKQWIANFTQYIKHGSVLANPGKSDHFPLIATPAKLVWYSSPQTFSKGRKQNSYLTAARMAVMAQYEASVMRSLGIPVADARMVTQSRWDATYDGIHYARPIRTELSDHWVGVVSGMFSQVVLNTVFSGCEVPVDLPAFPVSIT